MATQGGVLPTLFENLQALLNDIDKDARKHPNDARLVQLQRLTEYSAAILDRVEALESNADEDEDLIA